jgi:VWFA-related protein
MQLAAQQIGASHAGVVFRSRPKSYRCSRTPAVQLGRFTVIASPVAAALLAALAVATPKVDITVRSDHFPEIEVAVNVRDPGTGEGIYDLKEADFAIVEDGFKQAATAFNPKAKGKVDPVDIAFVFDETGSMQDEINAVRDNCIAFADNLKKLHMDARLALVTFSDKVERVKDYTADVNEFKSWLASIRADGGGDEPENPLDAMDRAMKLETRGGAKVVFILITDASFHSGDSVTKRQLLPVAKAIKLKGIDVYPIATKLERYRWLARETNGTYFDILEPFSKVLDALSVKLTSQYRIRYVSSNSAFDNSWRAVQVTVKDWDDGTEKYKSKANIKVSSTLMEKNRPSDAYGAQNMVDGDTATAWNEGAEGDGIGEWAQFDFDKPVRLKAIKIIAGYTKTKRIFRANNRVKKLRLHFSDGKTQEVRLGDKMTYQTIDIDRSTPTRSLKLEILDVYKGKRYHDTAISEVDFTFHR